MTGPEHYQAAERALSSVEDDSDTAMALLAEAQVHATLALAAAVGADLFADLAAEKADRELPEWERTLLERQARETGETT